MLWGKASNNYAKKDEIIKFIWLESSIVKNNMETN